MCSKFIDPKRSGVFDLSFIFYLFKVLLVLFTFLAFINVPMAVHTIRNDLESNISTVNIQLKWNKETIKMCDHPPPHVRISDCAAYRQMVKKTLPAKIAADKQELAKFKNQYYAMVVWLPAFIAACFMLIGKYFRSASLVTFINGAVLVLVPALNTYYPKGHSHFLLMFILIILAFLGHNCSLYLVFDELVQKIKEPSSEK
jgi:hypothetical protein